MKQIFLLIIGTLTFSYAATVNIVAKEDCPYYCSEYAVNKGFAVDIATYIFEQQGYNVEYKTLDSNEAALKDLTEKKHEIFLSHEQEKTDGLIFVKRALAYKYDVILVPKKSKWKLENPESLTQLKIGVREDKQYPSLVQEHLKKYKHDKNKIDISAGKYALKDNLVKLQYDKLDAIIDNQHLMQYFYHRKKKLFPFKVATKLEATPIYAIFSTTDYKATKHSQRFNRILKKLQGSEDMAKILKKYGLIELNIQKPKQ